MGQKTQLNCDIHDRAGGCGGYSGMDKKDEKIKMIGTR
jgi:hypothetical protein